MNRRIDLIGEAGKTLGCLINDLRMPLELDFNEEHGPLWILDDGIDLCARGVSGVAHHLPEIDAQIVNDL